MFYYPAQFASLATAGSASSSRAQSPRRSARTILPRRRVSPTTISEALLGNDARALQHANATNHTDSDVDEYTPRRRSSNRASTDSHATLVNGMNPNHPTLRVRGSLQTIHSIATSNSDPTSTSSSSSSNSNSSRRSITTRSLKHVGRAGRALGRGFISVFGAASVSYGTIVLI